MSEFNKEEIDYEDQLRQSERERKDLKNIIYELPVGLITVKGGNELTIDIANHEFCRRRRRKRNSCVQTCRKRFPGMEQSLL